METECVLSGLAPAETAVFHRGDVVVFRSRMEMTEQQMYRLSDRLKEFTARTGVEFLILSPDLDVVTARREELDE